MELDRSCHDLISELPQDIIGVILTKLPVRDAVTTCILSRSWRYKWTSMTHILFDVRVATTHRFMVRFINGFFSMHTGQVHKFALRTNCNEYDCLERDRWIPYVCQKDVKELTLQLGNLCRSDAPPCIFSCKNLTRLELLYACVVEPPPSFAGFSCLKHLVLRYVSIPRKDLERLVSSCPLLESLSLAYMATSSKLAIRAPNLKRLKVRGELMSIRLESTPLLVDITVHLDWRESKYEEEFSTSNRFEKLLGRIPKLERLCGQYNFTHCLSAGCGGRKFTTYEFLKHMELTSLHVDNPEKVLVALHLIFSSPNLQELHIKGRKSPPYKKIIKGPLLDYFRDPFLANRKMNRLELVKISGSPNELAFVQLIQFLLSRSPSLVMMIIKPSDFIVVNEGRRRLLLGLRRASHKASIVIS